MHLSIEVNHPMNTQLIKMIVDRADGDRVCGRYTINPHTMTVDVFNYGEYIAVSRLQADAYLDGISAVVNAITKR